MIKHKYCNSILVCLFILYTFVLVSCGKYQLSNEIYGTWEGEHQGKDLIFQFNNDQTFALISKDSVSGSVERVNGNFELDFSKKPISLSIRNIPQLEHPLFTIIEFVDSDSIRVAHFSPNWRLRPVSFSSTSMNLKYNQNGI